MSNNNLKTKPKLTNKLKDISNKLSGHAKLNEKIEDQVAGNGIVSATSSVENKQLPISNKTLHPFLAKLARVLSSKHVVLLFVALASFGAIFFLPGKNVPRIYTEGYYFKELNIDIDPLKTDATGANQILLNLLFLPLTKQNHQGAYESLILDIIPKEDGKTYSLKYKNQLKWSDGKNVDVEDLSFSLNQFIKSSSTKDGYQSFKGATVTKVDDSEISINLSEPNINFYKHLSQVILAPKHNYDINNGSVVQSGAEIYGGPYLYQGLNIIDGGLEVKLGANSNYANFEKVTNRRVNLRFVDSKKKLIDNFNNGFISATPQLDSLDVDPPTNQYFYQTPGQVYAFFNTARITDPNLRKALAYSINEKDIASQIKRVDNASIFNKYQLSQSQDGGSLGFNKEEAAKLFDQLGYKNNNGNLVKSDSNATLKFKIVALDDQISTKTANLLVDQLRNLGITIDLSLISPQDFKEEYYISHNYDILINSIDMGIKPDIKTYWSSDQPNKDLNFSNLNDSRIEGLIFAFKNYSDQTQKQQALLKFSQTWASVAPAKPLYIQSISLVSRYKISSIGDNSAIDIQDYLSKIPYFKLESE